MGANIPVLFGTADAQEFLLRIFREGDVPVRGIHVPTALRRSGLVAQAFLGRAAFLTLHPRHPLLEQLRTVLEELAGTQAGRSRLVLVKGAGHAVDLERPLGHSCPLAFRLLLQLVREQNGLQCDALRRRLPGAYAQTVANAIDRLVRAEVISHDGAVFEIAHAVPDAFRKLILEFGKLLSPRDPRLETAAPLARSPAAAFRRNADGAPLLFGTDVRLRNLMALAKYGPLHFRELRSLSGISAPGIGSSRRMPRTRSREPVSISRRGRSFVRS